MTSNAPKKTEFTSDSTERQIIIDDYEDKVIGTGQAEYCGDNFVLDDICEDDGRGGMVLVAGCGLCLIGILAAVTAAIVIKIIN